ncbi:ABC transporter ATP-binding protein [Oscillospiraceae bacterium LTW-04]|nr:ABC transporter ATP-binding protein [Oscillospiraceae bacterium MB24-C1]
MTELICAQNLTFCYGPQQVLSDVTFSVDEGEYLSIIGENGSGKSTLMHLLCGYLAPLTGQVLYCGGRLEGLSDLQRAQSIAVIAQNTPANFPFTCFEFVMLGLHPHRARFERVDEQTIEQIKGVMAQTDILSLADKPITHLSGGEYQRVLLARALAQRPRLLLLDEAMSDLDAAVKIKMNKLLKALVQKGLTVIAINHDLSTAYNYSDRVVALNRGRLVANGSPQTVFTAALLENMFGIKAEIIPGRGLCVYDTI